MRYEFDSRSKFRPAPRLATLDHCPNLQSKTSPALDYMTQASDLLHDLRRVYEPLDECRKSLHQQLIAACYWDPDESMDRQIAAVETQVAPYRAMLTGLANSYFKFSELWRATVDPDGVLAQSTMNIGSWRGMTDDWSMRLDDSRKAYVEAAVLAERAKYQKGLRMHWSNRNFLRSVAGTLSREDQASQAAQTRVCRQATEAATEVSERLSPAIRQLTWHDHLLLAEYTTDIVPNMGQSAASATMKTETDLDGWSVPLW